MGVPDMDSLSRADKEKVNLDLAGVSGRVGYGVATSPDGFHWTPYQDNPVIREEPWRDGATADVLNGHYDSFSGVFRLYCKTLSEERSVAYAETLNGTQWVTPEVILPAAKMIRDANGVVRRNTQVHYGMGVTPYEGMYIGMLWIFRMYDDWSVDVIVASSRDRRDGGLPARDQPRSPEHHLQRFLCGEQKEGSRGKRQLRTEPLRRNQGPQRQH